MKFKSLMLAAAVLCAPMAASANDVYSIFPENCQVGMGGEGVVVIGNGKFSVTESHFQRVGERRDVGNGFREATYDIMSEGEAYGRERIRLRITPAQVDIVYQDGREFSAKRCR